MYECAYVVLQIIFNDAAKETDTKRIYHTHRHTKCMYICEEKKRARMRYNKYIACFRFAGKRWLLKCCVLGIDQIIQLLAIS